MADQLQSIQGQIELKCDANKFFDVWACKPHLIPQLCPNKITKIELLEGVWHEVGAVKKWSYLFKEEGGHGESTLTLTTRVEEIDVEKRVVRYSYHDGCILKNYCKTLKSKMEVTPKSETIMSAQGCIVKWSFEYEKVNEDAPEPTVYIDFLLNLAKEIDRCLFC